MTGLRYILSHRALPLLFGWYSFPVPLRVGGWVDVSGWLHTKTVYLWMVSNLSNSRDRHSDFVDVTTDVTIKPNHHMMVKWQTIYNQIRKLLYINTKRYWNWPLSGRQDQREKAARKCTESICSTVGHMWLVPVTMFCNNLTSQSLFTTKTLT